MPMLGDIQLRHDLDSGNHRAVIGLRKLQVILEVTVLAKANTGIGRTAVALDVNIRCPLGVCIDDDLVDQSHESVLGHSRGSYDVLDRLLGSFRFSGQLTGEIGYL